MPTATTAEAESDNQHPPPGLVSRHRRILTIALSAVAAAGLLVYGMTDDDDPAPPERRVPTAAVTYTVQGSGNAHITYLGNSRKGTATVLPSVKLPWTKSVEVPLSEDATITVVLPADGTSATCTLAVAGRHRQRATATGPHGRAICTAGFHRRANEGGGRHDAPGQRP